MMSRYFRFLLFAVVICISALPFMRAVPYGIVNCDDYRYVIETREVRDGLSWRNVCWAFTCGRDSIWMPITRISYELDYTISRVCGFGDWSGPRHWTKGDGAYNVMHAHSMVVHAVNAVLLFVLLCMLVEFMSPATSFGAYWAVPLLGALFWSLHPLRVESVAWVASRKDLVSMMFLFAALISWMKFRCGSGKVARSYVLSIVLFILAGMAKPSAMTFPALVMIGDFCFLGKFRPYVGGKFDVKSVIPYVVPGVIALALAIETPLLQAFGGAMDHTSATPFAWRALNAMTSLGVYIWHTIVPVGLAPQCEMRYPGMPRGWCLYLPIAAGVVGFIYCRLRSLYAARFELRVSDGILGGILWFVVALLPMLGFVGFGYHAFADRFTYIPSVGISLMLVYLVVRGGWHCKFAAIGAIVVPVLIVLSWIQTGYWKNDQTMMERTLAVDGDENLVAHTMLGHWYFEYPHDLEATCEHLRKARVLADHPGLGGGFAYSCALYELGRNDELQAYLHDLTEWFHSRAEKALGNRHSGEVATLQGAGFEQVPEDVKVEMPPNMRYAKIVGLIADRALWSLADDEIGMEMERSPRNPFLFYLKGLLEQAKSGNDAATIWWRKIDTECDGCEYLCFRFLKKDWRPSRSGNNLPPLQSSTPL